MYSRKSLRYLALNQKRSGESKPKYTKSTTTWPILE